jgi:hypothetical protein
MTEDQIKHMVDRFLSWKLPDTFNPDGGISFAQIVNEGTQYALTRRPSGTNLFDSAQANAMIRHLIEGMPSDDMTDVDDEAVHMAHCYYGEYEGSCKYGDDNCPATPPQAGDAEREIIDDMVAAWLDEDPNAICDDAPRQYEGAFRQDCARLVAATRPRTDTGCGRGVAANQHRAEGW